MTNIAYGPITAAEALIEVGVPQAYEQDGRYPSTGAIRTARLCSKVFDRPPLTHENWASIPRTSAPGLLARPVGAEQVHQESLKDGDVVVTVTLYRYKDGRRRRVVTLIGDQPSSVTSELRMRAAQIGFPAARR